jgi:NADP-dependent 3-hydroxy acid dehydrogenase YdfG
MTNVLVIGGTTRGIGRSFVKHSKSCNYKLFVPNPEIFDVRSSKSVHQWFDEHPQMDYTLYCAGVKILSWIKDLDIHAIRESFDVNVIGFTNVLREIISQQSHGRICAITSSAAVHPMRTSIDYCSSKAALEMAIHVAARELSEWHITGIRPTVVADTEMTQMDIETISKLRGWTEEQTLLEMGTMLHSADVADVAHWLLFSSPHSMSGSILDIGTALA